MLKSRLRIATLFGIPVRIHISWLLIFLLVTWSLAGSYFPARYPDWSVGLSWFVGILTSLLFFGSVLLHELGHALVARSFGVPVEEITLFIFGGLAQISEEPKSPGRELLMAGAGPFVSIILSGLFAVLHLLTRAASEPIAALALYLGGINLTLGLFNLIPGFPLDGGRVLRAILWAVRRDLTVATRWAARAGQVVAYLFIFFGVLQAFSGNWQSGLWIVFIGFFLDNAARSSYAQVSIRNLLDGHTVQEIMSQDCTLLPAQLTLDVFVDEFLMHSARRCYTVGNAGQMLGLLSLHNVREVPKEDWRTTRVGEVATPLDKLQTVGPDSPLWDALQLMTSEGVNQLPVMDKYGNLMGMLSRDNLITFLRNMTELKGQTRRL